MIPIVTMVDINYFPGLITLLESIVQNGNLPKEQEYIVIESEQLSNRDRNLIKHFGLNVKFIEQPEYSDVCINWFTNWQGLAWYVWIRKMLKKLYLFNMVEYQKIIFIDADMLCMGDLNELFEKKAFSARPDYAKTQAMIFDKPQVNTGLMVISPLREDFNGMINLVKERPREILSIKPSSDQTIINYYFWKNKPESINFLEHKWGVSKRTVEEPKIFMEHMKDVRLLHFVGFKPWWGSDASQYVQLEDIWQKIWQQAKDRLKEVS